MRILSPVFFKELGQLAVSRKMLVMQAILLFVLIVYFVFAMATVRGDSDSRGARLGRDLFEGLVSIEVLAVVLFAPIVTAGVVCGEREANTLGLLFLTRLKAFQIVQDKGLSRLTLLLMILLVSMPFMFAALLFGGVENQQIAGAVGNILSLMLLAGAISLLCSTISRGVGAALVMAYAFLLAYLVVIPLLLTYGMSQVLHLYRYDRVVTFVNPLVSTFLIFEPYTLRQSPWLAMSWVSNLMIGLAVYGLAVLIASLLLRRVAFSGHAVSGENAGMRRAPFGGVLRKLALAGPAVLFDRGRKITGNPVRWKESGLFHDNLKTTLAVLGNAVLVVYGVTLLLLGAGHDLDEDWPHFFIHVLTFAVFGLFAAILGACSFSRQKESGTFDVLLTTLLPGRTVVMGTFAGLLKSIAPFVMILVAELVVGAAMARREISVFLPLVNIAVYLPFFLVLGMYVSLRRQTTAGALGWTLGILLVLAVVVPFLAVIIHDSAGRGISGALMAFSPDYWIAASPTVSILSGHRHFERDFGGLAGYVLVTAGYFAATAGMLYAMAKRFDVVVGRQAGGVSSAESTPSAGKG